MTEPRDPPDRLDPRDTWVNVASLVRLVPQAQPAHRAISAPRARLVPLDHLARGESTGLPVRAWR